MRIVGADYLVRVTSFADPPLMIGLLGRIGYQYCLNSTEREVYALVACC